MVARKKKKVARKKTTRAAPKVNLVVGSKVKEAVKAHGYRMAGDFGDALNAKVHELIKAAAARCGANNRGTVRPHDL